MTGEARAANGSSRFRGRLGRARDRLFTFVIPRCAVDRCCARHDDEPSRRTLSARAAPPRTRRIHPLVATLVLATAALLATPDPAQAQACPVPTLTGRQQIWTGTVTVGTRIAGGRTSYYGFEATTDPPTGALSDTMFDIGSNSHTIVRIQADVQYTTGGLVFGLSSSLTTIEVASLRLHVCGVDYDFADATTFGTQPTYYWDSAGLDWSSVTSRTLYLSVPVAAPNAPALGAPTITGKAQVGETLTAVTTGIVDADGLTSPTYTYQWIRVTSGTDADIAGATSSTYTLVAADLGKMIKVRVTFEDDEGNTETLTSAATATVAGGELAVKTVRQIEALLAAKAQRTPAQRKVSSQLLPARQAQGYGVARLQAPVEDAADEMTMVDIRADVTPEVLARIRDLGGTVITSVPRYRAIRARLPLAGVEPLATLDAVQTIRPADQAVTRKDDTSEGDVAHRANSARTTHSVDGTGIGIGVLSNGVRTLAARQASDDLPDRVTVLPGQAGRGDEGTAMLEIVHDLAPGAELYFATAHGGQAQFAANIEALCEAGAEVIVDDTYYFREAAFQDDLIAQGVNAAVADGCVFITAGGNGGNLNDGTAGVWEGDYAAGSTLSVNGVPFGVAHDFGGDVEKNRITEDSPNGYVLQWADPLGGSANDYDLFLIDSDDSVLDSSTGTQDGTQDPIEFISSFEDDHTDARLLIVKTSGAADRYLRLDTLEGQLAEASAGNLFGHAAAENAVTVAAVDARVAAGSGGVFNGREPVRRSNSDGPRRIFFEADGTPITAGNFSSTGGKLLQKPDLAAATCVSTSTPGFSTFCGTSSAAPHAAAIAALMLEAAGGPDNLTPAALRTAMTGASLDIEATGVDRDSGAGIVMAPGAVDAVDVAKADRNKAPTVDGTLADQTLAPGGAAVTINVAGAFDDPDDDPLTYTVLSSDPDPVKVTVSGSMLTLTPNVPGVVALTVRATDSSGLSTTSTVSVTVAAGTRDYDVDNDGLIEVGNLAQLDAVRYDLNGDGMVDVSSDGQSYYSASAFVDGALDMGCPSGCTGYELTRNLDFDTNGSGGPDAGDTYWNGGEGWVPIGGDGSLDIGTFVFLSNPFTVTFEGNGHTVSNLFIDTDNVVLVGLFGLTSSSIRNVGAIDVDVTGVDFAGGLIGFNFGEIQASYVTGSVSGRKNVGGLVGVNHSNGKILASYATSRVAGDSDVGGLVGDNRGKITAGYATGHVSGEKDAGGLVGDSHSTGEIHGSYATSRVTGDSDVGGLVGSNEGTVTVSYWDTNTSGHPTGSSGEGKTTAELQTPTGYSGIYQSWNADRWHFGTASQYPALKANGDGQGQATWQELGYQLREGPTLTATASPTQVVLSWTSVTASHWTQAPSITYTLTRDDGDTSETLGESLSGLTITDTNVTAGTTYTYQIAAVVQGGEASRSAQVSVVVPTPVMMPSVTLLLTPGSISENGGVSTVTASLDRESSAVTTVTVSAMPVDPAVSGDFVLSTNWILTIAADQTDSTGTVTVRAVNNTVDAPNKTVTVSATADNTQGVTPPAALTLAITDDDAAPVLTLAVGPSAITEAGGSSTVTVRITNGVTFAEDQEIALSFAGTATKGTDYTVALESLTFTAEQSSVATTVTAVQDRVDDDAETILITASHGGGTIGAEQTITIIDDDPTTCSGGMAGTYPCSNVDLMSFLALTDIGGGEANDIWGWTDSSTGKEYAIMGRTTGTSFVDISDPVNPIYLGNLPPHSSDSTWRDVKVYADHAFIVTEADDSGMQVFDLTQLRMVASPPATFSETAHYSGFSTAHNLAINEDSGFAYAVGTNDCGGGLHMIDIQTPTSPTSAGCFSADGHTHDAQCVNYDGPDDDHQGKEICFNSNVDTLTIVDVTNKAAPAMLSRTGYTGSRYAHQGWLTEDHAYFLLDDESDEEENPNVTNTRTYMWDVSDLDAPAVIGFHDSTTTATDHNQYVKGKYTYQSNYQAGLRILDITDIANGNLSEEAFFDVYPGSDSTSFNGAWSNYPFFDSGIVIVSGIEQGLFILRPNLVDGVNPALASAAVNGAALTLTYGEVLDGSSTPATDAFTVTVAGSGRMVTHVSVSGRVVTLTLASAVAHGETVTVSYSPGTNPIRDAAGNGAIGLSNEPVATVAAANSPATGAPTITGTARVDETLTAVTTGIMDADGLTSPSYTYQWIRVDSGTDADISGATSSTYTLVAADEGTTIKVKVSFTDDDGNPETRTSAATATVAAANSPATGAPTITGTARVGETLTAVTTGIMDADGLTSPSYTYQWIRVDSGTDADISGATSSTYTLVAADEGTTIKVRVSFTDDDGDAETRTSAATATVAAANSPATGAPTITGTAQVGQTLTAVTTGIMDADGLTSPSYTYQWIRVISSVDADISGATSSTYTLVAADEGTTIKVRVSFTDDASHTETRTSAATATVAAANSPATGAPTITGTAQVGQTLTAVTTGIMDADGLTSPSYTYQWIRVISSVDADISGATSSTYTLVAADEGTTIKVRVSFTDDASHTETRTSAATATVAAATTPTISAVAVTSTPQLETDTYGEGEEIQFTVAFSEAVTVTGMPQFVFSLGNAGDTRRVNAGYDPAASTDTELVFAYTVVSTDEDDNGIFILDDATVSGTAGSGSIVLGLDGSIVGKTSEVPASLAHSVRGAQSGHKVDGVRPSFLSAAVDGASLTLTYDEPLDGSSTPDAGDFTVSGGDYTRTVTRVSVSGSTVALTLNVGAEHLETGIQVSYTPGMERKRLRDVPGNEALGLSREPVTNDTPDTTSPTVSSLVITSNPGGDQIYAAGEVIELTVTFSETVEVTGTPQLRLRVGSRTRTAGYLRGTDTAALVFGYEVVEGDEDTDGVSMEANSLTRNVGTIRDEARNNAELDHDGLAADSGHKVDGVKPRLAATGGAVVNGTTLALTYDEPLDGSSTPEAGDFTVAGGDRARTVSRVVVRGATVELTLNAGAEHLEAGIQVSYTPGANPIQDAAGNEVEALSREAVRNDTPDTSPPEVESLAISSNPGSDQTYAAGDEIEVTVRFSETVVVTGTLRLRLRVGSRNRTAGYLRGTDTAAVVFGYEVVEGDEDTDGVSMEANSLTRNVGTIRDGADNNALLSHDGLAADARHKVDGVRPSFLSAAVDGASLTLTYGEGLDEGSRPAPGDFTVEVDGSGRSVSGVSVSGSVVTLTLDPAVEHGDTGIRVSYTVGTNPIQDEVGNDAAGLSNRSATNTTGAPNTDPEITSPGSFDVPENRTVARRLAARDTDPGDEVTAWAIAGGADQSEFSIASDTGELSFRDPPDFEAPGDNEYVVTVEVKSGTGARELTVEKTFTITVTDEREPPEVPDAPTFSGETADSLTVNWSEPDNTGPPITDYDVQYRKKGTVGFTDGGHEGPGLSLTLSDLEPGTAYDVQVKARNDEGASDWSASGEGMTVTPLTVVMTSGTDPPVSGSFMVRISFSESVSGFSGSDIESDQDPECTDDLNNPVFCDPGIGGLQTADDRVFTTTVTPGTDRVAHSYTLTLTVPGGAVRSSVGSKPNEEPEEPLEVRVSPPGVEEPISSLGLRTSGGNGTVRLSWNLPSDNGGSAIIRYEHRYQAVGEGWSDWENVGAGTSGVMVGNLINGREYVFEVRAVNALGKGGAETVQATPERRITPRSPPPGGGGGGGGGGGLLFPPGAPASLMAMAGEGMVRLEWSPPESDGGTPILRYEYRLKEGRGEFGEWIPIADSAPDEVNAAGYTVEGLGNGTVYVFELRAVNLVGEGPVSEAVEAVMGLDRAYGSNFLAGDLQGGEASLERGPFGGGPQSLRLRFGAGLRFEESELDGEGEVTETRLGSYGYRYTSRTTGELRLDHDGGESCEVRLTFRGEGAGSYSYRCGGALRGQGSFRLTGLNRGPEVTSTGPFEVVENQAMVGQLEAVDPDEGDGITGYGIAGGADGGLFAVVGETGELLFREAPDYEDPGDVESAEPASGVGDNEYIVVVEVRSGEGERERKGRRAIRVRVSDEEEPPEITSLGPFEVVENQTRVGQVEAVDQDKQDEITEYGIAGGADGGLFAVEAETGELMFREAPDYEDPSDVESAEPASGAADNEYIVVVEVRSGEGERERKGSRAIRVRVSDEEEPPKITSLGPFEVVENRTRVGQLEAVDQDKQDEITGYGIAGGADGELFAVVEETGELMFREAPDYEDPSDVESAEPASGAGDNEYIVVVEVRSGEGERERKGRRAIRVRVSDEEEPPEITSLGPFEVVENRTRVGQLEAVDPDAGDEIGGYGIAGGADAGLFAVEAETGELLFREAPDYEAPGDVASDDPQSAAGDNEYIVVVEVRSGEGERERKGSRAIRVRVSDEEEPPGAPAAPAVTAEGSDSLKVSWREPENRGPEIVDYEVRYREADEAGYRDGGHEGRGLEVRLSGLKEGTVYEVQVRAVNQEGMSEWSEPGEGRTDTEEADPEEPDPEDPSDFTEGDLEGRRLTLRQADADGTTRSLELRFGEDNRFEQIESVGEQAATRSEGASRSGSYTYERTGPGRGTVRLAYDDGSSCEVLLAFTESGAGTFSYDCGERTPAEGSFRLTTGSLFVPVILSAAGRSNSFFTSELTLTNRGEREVRLDYAYTAHRGGGSGKTSDVLAPGMQKIETDALTYLRGLGVPIPETGNRIGTLRVEARLGSEVEAVVRTTTLVPEGRAGLAYLGVAEEEGFDEAVYLCGLRQNSRDRSNVAFQNMGAEEEGAITVRTTVYSGDVSDTSPRVLEEVTLEPGGFHQYSGLLGRLESVEGNRQGYVKVERVEGTAPFYAYGVINDQANSDGSFVFPVTASSLEGTAGQTLPVIVETSEFTSELMVTNFSEEPRRLDFQFVAEGIEADDKTVGFSMELEAGEQQIIPELVEELRREEMAGLGTTRGFYLGPLLVTAEEGDLSGIVIGARTGSEGGGGQYSVFYNAVPEGEAFTKEAWVEGLQQNEENRSNLALVNTGEVDGSASVFHLEIYDGETGLLAETVVTKPIPARGWHQINGILGSYAPETRQGYIRIEKVSGANPFLAYGVVNDGGAPGERSGDGAYLPARE